MPTILIKKSDTPSAVPTGSDLTNLAGGAEIAVNTADKRVFSMNSSSAIIELGTNPGSLTTADASATVLRSGSATITDLIATSASITTLTATSASVTNLTATSLVLSNLSIASANVTTLTSGSATITNLLATSLTVSSGSTLNGGVVVNEPGADVDFRVEGDTVENALFVQGSDGYVGVGTNAPSYPFHVVGSGDTVAAVTGGATSVAALNLGNSTNLADGGIRYDNNTDALIFRANNGEKARIDSAGNLGLGVTPSAWSGFTALQVSNAMSLWSANNDLAYYSRNVYYDGTSRKYVFNGAAVEYIQGNGTHAWYTAASGTAGNAITFTQAMTLTATGRLGVGVTSPSSFIHAKDPAAADATYRFEPSTNSYKSTLYVSSASSGDGGIRYDSNLNQTGLISYSDLIFYVGNGNIGGTVTNERARITAGGSWLVGTTDATPATSDVAGFAVASSGITYISADANPALYINRKTNDGELVRFYQAGVQEGSISVSGNTVSYNAFAGSHWSQLQDGSKPDILRGTVMESINELCVWPNEENERLPKAKISDTAGSKKVYGVFMAWDNDWTETNDMYVTAVGAFICRVNSAVTVQEGDLLESNGDGTARVQADDIIRSSTIGKVTSTVKTHEYDDGSYCVPTVLYCG